jgi:hypothetical protein
MNTKLYKESFLDHDESIQNQMLSLMKKIELMEFEIENEAEVLACLKDKKINELMIPFSHLGMGRTFGELAL